MAFDEWYERTAAPLLSGNLPEAIVAFVVLSLLVAFALASVATLGAAFFKSQL